MEKRKCKILFVDNTSEVLNLQEEGFKQLKFLNKMPYDYDCGKQLLQFEGENKKLSDKDIEKVRQLTETIKENLEQYDIVYIVIDFRLGKDDGDMDPSADSAITLILQDEKLKEAFQMNSLIFTVVTKYSNTIELKLDKDIKDKIIGIYLPIAICSKDSKYKFRRNEYSSKIVGLGNYIWENFSKKGNEAYKDIEDLLFADKTYENYWGLIIARSIINPEDKIWSEVCYVY